MYDERFMERVENGFKIFLVMTVEEFEKIMKRKSAEKKIIIFDRENY